MLPHRSPYAQVLLLAALLAGALAAPGGAPAAPEPGRLQAVLAGSVGFLPYSEQDVSLVATDVAVPTSGSLDYTAVVRLDEPTDYLQVRLRLRRPSGRLLYQKTFVESDVPAGTRSFRFLRRLDDFELSPDEYPIELTVLAEGKPDREWTVDGDFRVYDATIEPLPVAVVVKVESPPQTDPQGRFVTDPGLESSARNEVRKLAETVLSVSGFNASLAIAPTLLEEWRHIAQGYELATSGGIVAVGPDDPTAVAYGETLDRLRAALATGRLELLHTPYADPDLSGLQSTGRQSDLAAHLERARVAYSATMESTPSAGTYCSNASLTTAFAQHAYSSGIQYALASADVVLRQKDETAAPGAYRADAPSGFVVLVPDRRLVERTIVATDAALVGGLFSKTISAKRPAALPLTLEVGPGSTQSLIALLPQLKQAATVPWLQLVTAGHAAASAKDSGVRIAETLSAGKAAPPGLWSEVAAARDYAVAYRTACPQDDPEAAAAVVDSLIAECAYWAGQDSQWALADRARGFAASARRRATTVFEKVTITAERVTLAGSTGSVPFSISNASPKPLSVVLQATGQGVRPAYLRKQALPQGDTYLTVPVDLRQSLNSDVTLEVRAGAVLVASRTVSVRASYLDRLAVIGATVIVLLGLLLYISRRVRNAENRDVS